MIAKKSNFAAYSSSSKISGTSRSINIFYLINNIKEKERREKILKIYTPLGLGSILLLGIIIYL